MARIIDQFPREVITREKCMEIVRRKRCQNKARVEMLWVFGKRIVIVRLCADHFARCRSGVQMFGQVSKR